MYFRTLFFVFLSIICRQYVGCSGAQPQCSEQRQLQNHIHIYIICPDLVLEDDAGRVGVAVDFDAGLGPFARKHPGGGFPRSAAIPRQLRTRQSQAKCGLGWWGWGG